ncbi:MAG: hypothetical protein G01um10145_72 [Microgenomates group bacterium Gr01-1014_5]|nr:MAG: hypothetical protein G01um10145_72 [Microgenomates group bacterium Gr01-1014_5]
MTEIKTDVMSDREKFDQGMRGVFRTTLIDGQLVERLSRACASVGSKFEIILKPGDNCFGTDGKCLYNKGVTGRFDIEDYRKRKVITELKGPKVAQMGIDVYWVRYQIGETGYFAFCSAFDKTAYETI